MPALSQPRIASRPRRFLVCGIGLYRGCFATKGYMERESGAIDAGNCRLQSEHDFHMWFSYLHGGTSDGQIRIREYSGGHLRMTVTSSSLVLRTNATTLDTETVATDTGVWYEYYAKADGANAEVWRRKKGTTDAMVKVLETVLYQLESE